MVTRTATTIDGLTIWCVELDKERAQEIARTCREQGRRARVSRRLVRALGAETIGYVVLASDLPKSPTPDEEGE